MSFVALLGRCLVGLLAGAGFGYAGLGAMSRSRVLAVGSHDESGAEAFFAIATAVALGAISGAAGAGLGLAAGILLAPMALALCGLWAWLVARAAQTRHEHGVAVGRAFALGAGQALAVLAATMGPAMIAGVMLGRILGG